MHRSRRVPAALSAVLSGCLGLVGQDAGRDKPAEPRTIVIQNLAPFARRQPVACVVPFAQGVAQEDPGLNVEDRQTVWQPFGARWPD
ncbi:MAG: hypothetical protein VX044_01520, partial [Planctomycetota bacterium]|nr:hypothetical protein [Planctomycetota bacterium]